MKLLLMLFSSEWWVQADRELNKEDISQIYYLLKHNSSGCGVEPFAFKLEGVISVLPASPNGTAI